MSLPERPKYEVVGSILENHELQDKLVSMGFFTRDSVDHSMAVQQALDAVDFTNQERNLLEEVIADSNYIVSQRKMGVRLFNGHLGRLGAHGALVYLTRLRQKLPSGVEIHTINGLGYSVNITKSNLSPEELILCEPLIKAGPEGLSYLDLKRQIDESNFYLSLHALRMAMYRFKHGNGKLVGVEIAHKKQSISLSLTGY